MLTTAAAAQLFAVRTAAPLQDAIACKRVDAAQWLLAPDASGWLLGGAPPLAEELLRSRDAEQVNTNKDEDYYTLLETDRQSDYTVSFPYYRILYYISLARRHWRRSS